VCPRSIDKATLAAVALAAVARTEMATAALGIVRGVPSSARVIVAVVPLFTRCCAAAGQLFTTKLVKCAFAQRVARPPLIEAPPLYLQRWHWQGPQWGAWAFQCAAWHSGVQ